MGWLSVGSLLFGILALSLPIVSMVQKNQWAYERSVSFSSLSLGSCAVSVSLQLFYQSFLVSSGDLATAMDTIGTAASMAALLLIATIILNALAVILLKHKKVSAIDS